MANPEHVKIVKQGAEAIATWREEHPGVRLDLYKAKLDRAALFEANLDGANLSGADLTAANLSGAVLSGANLSAANLSVADLSRANLSRANLSAAALSVANLSAANLSAANLARADLLETVFSNTDLTTTQGLETCHHYGPSTLDHRTLARSGPLPLAFLRGCGLPDAFIDYLPSLLGEPLQFYSCFISYSSQDDDFAQRLHADLQDHGVRCWFAPEDIQSGRKLHEQIDQAIQVHDKLLLVLSPHSMTSNWVEFELRRARQREFRDQCRVLFPVRLVDYAALRDWECFDAETGRDLATEVREYFIPNFTNWKDHDAYHRAFKRLLQDLRPEI